MSKHIGSYSAMHGPAGKVLTEYTEQNIPLLWNHVAERIVDVQNTGSIYTGHISGYTVSDPFLLTEDKAFYFSPHIPSNANPSLSINTLPAYPIFAEGGEELAAGELDPNKTYVLLFRTTIAQEGSFPAFYIQKGPPGDTGPKGDEGPPGPPSGLQFPTVAALLASTNGPQGVGSLWKGANFHYREAAAGATDHHLTTAGGVKLYVLQGDDGWYNFLAMNPARDGVTDDAPKLRKLLAIRPLFDPAEIPGSNPWPEGPSIHIPAGDYFMNSGPWGIQVKAVTRLRGESYNPPGHLHATTLHFPVDCCGMKFNHFDTFENIIETVGTFGTGGTIGSVIDGIGFRGILTTGTVGNPNAHGLWLCTATQVRNCYIDNFNGNGIHAIGTSIGQSYTPWTSGTDYARLQCVVTAGGTKGYRCLTDPGTASTSQPTHTDPSDLTPYPDGFVWQYVNPLTRGGPSISHFHNVGVVANRGSGIFIDGGDSNVVTGITINAVANGRHGINDSNFLGNTWIGCHSRGNGCATNGGNPANQSSMVSLQNGPGGTYNKYYAKFTTTEALLAATQPGTDDSVWIPTSGGGINVPFHPYFPVWLPGQPVGTYFKGGGFVGDNPNARNTFLGCYQEGDESPGFLSATSIAVGGITNWQPQGGHIQSNLGVLTFPSGVGVIDENTNRVSLGGDPNSSGTLFRALNYKAWLEPLTWIWQYDHPTGNYQLINGGSFIAHYLTTANTTQKMGTSRAQPYLMHFPTLAIGGGGAATTTRRQTTSNAMPATGEYAAGDVIWNTNAAIDTYVGWVCTGSGVAGTTPAWATGTNYAIHNYVLATNGNTYRCSLDPGGSFLSTIEPSHSSGEVIRAAASVWTINTDYPQHAFILASNGKYYRCSFDPGATFSTIEPTHASGEITNPIDGYGWTFVANWANSTNYFLNDCVKASNGKYYRCTIDPGNTFCNTEPTHDVGEIKVADGYAWLRLSTLWLTGTDYALNAFILASNGKYYRCSTDPGAVASTVEPSHSSGAVTGADNYGWTFVSNTTDNYGWTFVSSAAATFLPFGKTIDMLEVTAAKNLTADIDPQQILYSAAIASGSVALGLNVPATKGATFKITRTGSGAGVLNVGTGPLKPLITNSWCDVTYNGTAWYLAAYGTL